MTSKLVNVLNLTHVRYQHVFAAITRGLNLVCDWQGYSLSQSTFFAVCKKFEVNKEEVSHVLKRREDIQQRTQVLVLIDPMLATPDAHFGRDDTNYGTKAFAEWKKHHNCASCRCSHFKLNENPKGMQFGIADPDQYFFDQDIPKETMLAVKECRHKINIWCGNDSQKKNEETQSVEHKNEGPVGYGQFE